MLRLAFVGDVMLGRLVNRALQSRRPDHVWGDTLTILQGADWRACNLECVLSDRGRPWNAYPKAFHFRSDARNVAALKAARIDAVSLANNHVLDFEHDALLETVSALDAAGIGHAGAGRDISHACAPVVQKVGQTKIGMIAFTDNERHWEAGQSVPGLFYVPVNLADVRAQALLDVVRETRDKVDVLVLSAHWGGNWGYEPPPQHREFGRALVKAGADIVFGHSCHVFRGIEIVDGRAIFYSTGDFVDDYAVDEIERNDESFIFIVTVGDGGVAEVSLHPVVISDCSVRLAGPVHAGSIVGKMIRLCAKLGTEFRWDADTQCLQWSAA